MDDNRFDDQSRIAKPFSIMHIPFSIWHEHKSCLRKNMLRHIERMIT